MIDDLKKVLGKKTKINPMEKEAKLNALKGMKKAAGSVMADEFRDMNKVTVAAPDKEGLQAGLETAEEVLEKSPEELSLEGSEESDEIELPETETEIDDMIAKLMEKKQSIKAMG